MFWCKIDMKKIFTKRNKKKKKKCRGRELNSWVATKVNRSNHSAILPLEDLLK